MARVAVGREAIDAFVPDSGRLAELLCPGAEVYVKEVALRDGRRTTHDLCLVRQGGTLVSVDSRLPNRLVAKALEDQTLPWFSGYRTVAAEPRVGCGRLDFHLSGPWLPDCFYRGEVVHAGAGRRRFFPGCSHSARPKAP